MAETRELGEVVHYYQRLFAIRGRFLQVYPRAVPGLPGKLPEYFPEGILSPLGVILGFLRVWLNFPLERVLGLFLPDFQVFRLDVLLGFEKVWLPRFGDQRAEDPWAAEIYGKFVE